MELKKQAMDWIESNEGMNSTALIRDMLTTIERLEQLNSKMIIELENNNAWIEHSQKQIYDLEDKNREANTVIYRLETTIKELARLGA